MDSTVSMLIKSRSNH